MQKTFIIITAVIFIICSNSQSYSQSKLKEILDKHAEAIGGIERISEIKSAAAYSTVSYMGAPAKAVSLIKFPYQYYLCVEMDPIRLVMGGDGMTGWSVDLNGSPRLISSEEQQPFFNELYYGSYSYLFDDRNPGRVK